MSDLGFSRETWAALRTVPTPVLEYVKCFYVTEHVTGPGRFLIRVLDHKKDLVEEFSGTHKEVHEKFEAAGYRLGKN